MSELQTREQMLSGLSGVTDIVDLLKKVDHVQYKTGWQSKYLATDAIREITRLRQLLSEAEKREREAKRIAVNAESYGYGHGIEAAAGTHEARVTELRNNPASYKDGKITKSAKRASDFHERSAQVIRALKSEER